MGRATGPWKAYNFFPWIAFVERDNGRGVEVFFLAISVLVETGGKMYENEGKEEEPEMEEKME